MRVYVDSSALLKRAIKEAESEPLAEEIDRLHRDGTLLLSASLAWTEVARALRTRAAASYQEMAEDLRQAMLGIAEHPLDAEIMNLSRRIEPNQLRSLDAIHLAAAIAVDADLMITYAARLAEAADANGIPVSAPS
ncbi:MAG: PIN domain-containing protein [Saccharopolyspora sp.]|uniref:PIN domain-containing protein n=1 Tax=Saccharopolyspora sp. SCSIO 74807 TaxID=3118084 RepID=UPI0019099817|nr:PIN domain-containing protein [Saccharopolyspora sp. HNM0986]MBQ6641924.1 PIN domain-containing protein [Saccharopolyspora sp.]